MLWLRAAALALCVGLTTPAMAQDGGVEGAVSATYAAFDEAFNKGDAKALGAMFTEDGIFLPPTHDVLKGPDAAEKFFSGQFASGAKDHKFELIEADSEGDIIFAAAKWSAAGKDASGAAASWSGIATHVFEKQDDGSLKLKVATFN